MKCCICEDEIKPQRNPETGQVVWTKGHNALPVRDGRCCDVCNHSIVIAARLADLNRARRGYSDS